ncbi:hypothetical protein FHY17_001976 [Xanthomonas arboricola]|uniref:Uncharacterized protein n=1 Tax=Xanthomonas arboricola TaxID=56448 RepID=A0AB73GY91_9XANT|nr:hypothetical protein [Xanthomonas arboricola]MBB4768331.1 hypothetical protein [Xanthomonas arboricola]MBB5670708.1 hypothetical protein [Xanthomonas arboricola]
MSRSILHIAALHERFRTEAATLATGSTLPLQSLGKELQ